MLKYNNNRNRNDIKFYINELCIKKTKQTFYVWECLTILQTFFGFKHIVVCIKI